jgi:hypothetical protein
VTIDVVGTFQAGGPADGATGGLAE